MSSYVIPQKTADELVDWLAVYILKIATYKKTGRSFANAYDKVFGTVLKFANDCRQLARKLPIGEASARAEFDKSVKNVYRSGLELPEDKHLYFAKTAAINILRKLVRVAPFIKVDEFKESIRVHNYYWKDIFDKLYPDGNFEEVIDSMYKNDGYSAHFKKSVAPFGPGDYTVTTEPTSKWDTARKAAQPSIKDFDVNDIPRQEGRIGMNSRILLTASDVANLHAMEFGDSEPLPRAEKEQPLARAASFDGGAKKRAAKKPAAKKKK